MNRKILISDQLSTKVPELELSCIECDVEIQLVNENLWGEIQQKVVEIASYND